MRKQTFWLAAAFLALVPIGWTQAAGITVDGSVCTLEEAITSANNDNAAGNGCVDGSGADTITLQADVTLTTQLPTISSAITIEGGGHFISGNNSLVVGRVLLIASGISVTLNATTVKNGNGGNGGGIYNNGTLTLTNSTVSGNTAIEGGGGFTTTAAR